jgi:hypothetical protein
VYFAGAALALFTVACGAEEARGRRSRLADADEVPSPRPPTPRERWPHAAIAGSLAVLREDYRSSHFTGEPRATLRGNELSKGYGQRGAELPVGALLIAEHQLDAGAVTLAMEKVAVGPTARWEFAVVDPEGWVVERGRIPSCVRCHAEAARDEVFGPAGL